MFYARRGPTVAPAIRLVRSLRTAGSRLLLGLLRWQELTQQRRRLLAMDDRMLKDMGITRADATREAERPFWDGRDVDGPSWR